MSFTFDQFVTTRGSLRIYGHPISDLTPGGSLGLPTTRGAIGFASIRAFAVGDFCTALPSPVIMTVFGKGAAAKDKCGLDGETVWDILGEEDVVALHVEKGKALETLENVYKDGIKGGVSIEDVRFESGRVRGTLRAWYEIKVFGQKIKDSKKATFSVGLQGCYSVLDFGIGDVQVCVRAAPPHGVELCAKLCVGKWGLSKCWDTCAYVDIPVAMSERGQGCACTSQSEAD